ncbi:hypothetical protein H477_4101 [[Clostridium] sordellii ATCC 9714]|nr:hypothetical protein H477_4101 [[Clostridium] sordellii ATCC 9714] [Paeniclostridium sordellii ATCC 9714]
MLEKVSIGLFTLYIVRFSRLFNREKVNLLEGILSISILIFTILLMFIALFL